MAAVLENAREQPFVNFADALLQPIEHSFTVASLSEMAGDAGLELIASAVDQFSRLRRAFDWNLSLKDRELQERYDSLPDVERWKVTNWLLLEGSPMLWFYLQRRDSPRPRRSEWAMADDFRRLRFRPTRTTKELFGQQADGSYAGVSVRVPFPPPPTDPLAARLVEHLDETRPLSATLDAIGLADASLPAIHRLRIQTATSGFPHLAIV
jgi:hypothetical protein